MTEKSAEYNAYEIAWDRMMQLEEELYNHLNVMDELYAQLSGEDYERFDEEVYSKARPSKFIQRDS